MNKVERNCSVIRVSTMKSNNSNKLIKWDDIYYEQNKKYLKNEKFWWKSNDNKQIKSYGNYWIISYNNQTHQDQCNNYNQNNNELIVKYESLFPPIYQKWIYNQNISFYLQLYCVSNANLPTTTTRFNTLFFIFYITILNDIHIFFQKMIVRRNVYFECCDCFNIVCVK